uniref:RRM domain-containing protein n=1 Tax=Elaeophora elaphi TaxID=1147741 RepID=A0A0R3RZ47_9BILA
MGADEPRFRVLHVSNISMTATREQIYQLFAFIGRIDEFKIYPSDNHPQLSTFTQKFAYVKFEDQKSVEVAQHLTNTVFIDRALVCIPSISDTIPDEDTALKTGGPAWPGQRQLPPNVVNQIQDLGDGQQMLLTVDPTLAALGLPPYPTLSANTEASKVEEIRRTVYVGNIPKDCDGEEVMKFFNDSIGETHVQNAKKEVMYLRMTSGTENLPCAYAYIEFTNQPTVPIALQNNGIEFKGRCLRIQHSRVAIIKPERKTADMALQEVEEAIRVNQNPDKAANALSKLNQGLGMDRSYSPLRRSGSPRRHRSRSSSRRRRSRSRSKSRRRHRSKSKDRRSRSRSREHRRRSHSRHRRLSRSKDRKEKDKEKERRDREKEREKKERKRSRSRTPHKKDDRRERDKDKDKKEKDRESNSRRDKERNSRSGKSDKKEEKDHDKGKKNSRKEKEREKTSRKSDNKSSSVKTEVKLQIEHGESMEVDHPEQVTASDETAMRERLMEKVLARNGPKKEESMDIELMDTDKEKDEQESKGSSSVDSESFRKKSRKRSKSSNSSSHSE